MSKFHINPETGEPGSCTAKKKCPYGDLTNAHYSNKEEARAAYEQQQKFKDSNSITLSNYDRKIEKYLENSPSEVSISLAHWMRDSFKDLEPGSRIIELGAGGGRDSAFLRDEGFEVIPTDASDEFVAHLKKNEWNARKINAITDDLPFGDAYLANAVLLHFNKEEAKTVLDKVAKSIPNTGVFAFTLKEGSGEEWSTDKLGSPRYFKYWQEDEIREACNEAGFDQVVVERDESDPRGMWLNVTASKTPPPPEDYRMNHQPDMEGAQAFEIDKMYPDFYERPNLYDFGSPAYRESIAALMKIKGNPDAEVTVYRSVPDTSYGINHGNWVTLSKSYAETHGYIDEETQWPVVSMVVKAKDIRTPGDDINEFGWFPEE